MNHRYSDDLDFFINDASEYSSYIKTIFNELLPLYKYNKSDILLSEDYTRVFIYQDDLSLKVEFVNDISYYAGKNELVNGIRIDNVKNILCNKLSAILGRDEPKDIFDLIHITMNYQFNWKEIVNEAKEKSVMNEIDILERISTFPLSLFDHVNWMNEDAKAINYAGILSQLAKDFASGSDNTLNNNPKIEDAKPITWKKSFE